MTGATAVFSKQVRLLEWLLSDEVRRPAVVVTGASVDVPPWLPLFPLLVWVAHCCTD